MFSHFVSSAMCSKIPFRRVRQTEITSIFAKWLYFYRRGSEQKVDNCSNIRTQSKPDQLLLSVMNFIANCVVMNDLESRLHSFKFNVIGSSSAVLSDAKTFLDQLSFSVPQTPRADKYLFSAAKIVVKVCFEIVPDF